MKHSKLVGLACLGMAGAGIGLREPSNVDEERFLGVALEMLQNGSWLIPHRAAEIYGDKPPIFMWTVAFFTWLIGKPNIALYIPGLFSAVTVTAMVYDLGRRLWTPRTGRNAALAFNPTLEPIVSVESELAGLDHEEALELLQSIGQDESGLDALARVGFDTLGLQTYLTAGPKEARAWTIRKGATAPEAAGVIHTDFQKGFIKAEVVAYEDLRSLGSVAAARDAGKYRLEGKDYVFQDGDVALFRFNN